MFPSRPGLLDEVGETARLKALVVIANLTGVTAVAGCSGFCEKVDNGDIGRGAVRLISGGRAGPSPLGVSDSMLIGLDDQVGQRPDGPLGIFGLMMQPCSFRKVDPVSFQVKTALRILALLLLVRVTRSEVE